MLISQNPTKPNSKNVKVLLIRPSDRSLGKFKKVGGVQHPMNLLSLATYLDNNSIEVGILDLEVEPIKSLKGYDIIGITAMTPNIPQVIELVHLAKLEGAKTVLGGIHPTVLPEDTIKETEADIVVRGEGEISLLEIAKGVPLNKIEGISYRDTTGIKHNPDRKPIENLDEIPIPNRSMLKLNLYTGSASPAIIGNSAVMFTSRGCPNDCNFCSAKYMHGKRVRFRSIGHIMQEVRDINALGFNHITIDDDTFTLNKKRILDFCNEYKKWNMTFDIDARVDTVDNEILSALKKSGCTKIAYGVESGSNKVLKRMRKGITLDQVKKAFKLTREAGIKTQALISIGHIEETKEDVELTKKLISEIEADYLCVSVITPYPKTEVYEYDIEKGYLNNIKWDNYACFKDEILWRTDNFTGDELVKIRDKMYKDFYINIKYILKQVKGLRNFNQLKYYITAALSVIKWRIPK
ncbi:MAG: B12-binding domain-containing radical SAM protein [Nanoarchaeota archaeon]|nr:B12-binding domain-containing radical SAM protein [Nanoarchaeota archaeon]